MSVGDVSVGVSDVSVGGLFIVFYNIKNNKKTTNTNNTTAPSFKRIKKRGVF